MEKFKLGNVKVNKTTKNEVLDLLNLNLLNQKKTTLFYLNAHCYNIAQKDSEYRNILNRADVVLNDGIGVEIGARIYKNKFYENLNGTDFTPEIFKLAERKGYKVFLLGGIPGVAEMATSKLKNSHRDLDIVGYSDGYFKDNKEIVNRINNSKADIVIVALGVPLQEKWINENKDKLNVTLLTGVGAFLDFISARVKRAPKWIRQLKLEWFYRLIQEPGRMWKRYILGNGMFFFYLFKNINKSSN